MFFITKDGATAYQAKLKNPDAKVQYVDLLDFYIVTSDSSLEFLHVNEDLEISRKKGFSSGAKRNN